MKNKIAVILITISIMLNCIPVFANTFDGYNTVNEIKEAEESILVFANDVVPIDDTKKYDNNDIDYSKICKIYPGMGKVFENIEINNEIIQNTLKNERYIYNVPIYEDGKTMLITVMKNEELTDDVKEKFPAEEIEKYEASVGKWDASSGGIGDQIIDYKGDVENALSDNNIENANVYFLGAICSNIRLVAVICTDNPADTKIKILEQFESEQENVGSKLDKNMLYSYNEIKAIVDADKEARKDFPDDATGGIGAPVQTSVDTTAPANDNSKIIIISAVSGVAVLAIVIAAICIVRKKRAKSLDEN